MENLIFSLNATVPIFFTMILGTGHSVSGIQAYPEGTEEGSTPPEQKEELDMEERIFCQCCGMPLDAFPPVIPHVLMLHHQLLVQTCHF